MNVTEDKVSRCQYIFGSSLCPVPVSTGHVAMRTRVQDWTRVRILTGPMITDHWTEAPPYIFHLNVSSILKNNTD